MFSILRDPRSAAQPGDRVHPWIRTPHRSLSFELTVGDGSLTSVATVDVQRRHHRHDRFVRAPEEDEGYGCSTTRPSKDTALALLGLAGLAAICRCRRTPTGDPRSWASD